MFRTLHDLEKWCVNAPNNSTLQSVFSPIHPGGEGMARPSHTNNVRLEVLRFFVPSTVETLCFFIFLVDAALL